MQPRPALLLALLASLMLVPGATLADESAGVLYQPCVACHGQAGVGNPALGAPALAGQDSAYLARQLRHFRSGVRGSDSRDTHGAQMAAMAAPLTDGAIEQLAQYLAALAAPAVAERTPGNLKNGNNFYQSKCGACHGGQAEGNAGLNAPALAFLDGAYLKRQYHNFQLGVRGAHADDKYGRQMKMMSTSLPTDQDLDDVIAFIHSQDAAQ